MPIQFNPAAFRSAGLQQAAADRLPDPMEFVVAKAKLEGWKEARELDKQRLGMAAQDQQAQMEDRAATIEAARGQVGVMAPKPAQDFTGPRTKDQSEDEAETEQVRSILGGMKDPRAQAAFLQTWKADREERATNEGLERVKSKLQDRLVGIANDPDAGQFAPEFEKLATELDQIQPGMDPKLAAAIIDDIGRREEGYSQEMRETVLWKQRQVEADQEIQAMMGQYPPGHPRREQLRAIALNVRLGDEDALDALGSLKAEDAGMVSMQLPGLGQVWMKPEQAANYQNTQADNLRASVRDQYRQKHETEMRALREREVALNEREKNKPEKAGPSISRGIRTPTLKEREDMIVQLMEENDLSYDEAWAESGRRISEHLRMGLAELGSGASAGASDKAGTSDPFLDKLTPQKRVEFEAMSPELQAAIRKKAGG